MPVTALAFGIGAAAISGLPPLNGFASEWLTFQGLIGAGGDGALVARGPVGGPARGRRARADRGTRGGLLRQGHRDDASSRCRAARARPSAHETARLDARRRWPSLAIACVGVGIAAGPVAAAHRGRGRTAVVGAAAGRPSTGGAAVTRSVGIDGRLRRRADRRPARRRRRARLARRRAPAGRRAGPRPGPAASRPSRRSSTPRRATRSSSGSSSGRSSGRRARSRSSSTRARRSRASIRYRGEVSHVIDERLYRPAPSRRPSAPRSSSAASSRAASSSTSPTSVVALVVLLLVRPLMIDQTALTTGRPGR